MDMKEIIEKIGEDKLKAAVKSGDPKAVAALVEEAGLELTEEQLEFIAGGYASWDRTDVDYDLDEPSDFLDCHYVRTW